MWFLIYAHTLTHSGIKRARVDREINKKAGLEWGKLIDGGLSEALNGAGAGAECEKNTTYWLGGLGGP